MPDTPSNDDQFADLFSRLPSARSAADTDAGAPRPGESGARDEAARGEPSRAADTGAPLSRRAARAAAQPDTAPGAAQPAAAQPTAPQPAAAQPVPATAAHATASGPPVTPGTPAAPAPAPAGGTLDALFGGELDADEQIRHKRQAADRRKSRIAKWVILGVVLAILGGIVGGGYYVWSTYEDKIRAFMGWEEPRDFAADEATGEATVTIVAGDNGSSISQTLFDAGVTKTPDAFYRYLVDEVLNPTFYPGAYKLQQKMTSAAALEALENPDNKLENTAQLREGLTVDQSLPILSDGTGIPLEELQAAVADPSAYGVSAQSLEGWLFPATYTFGPDATAQSVIQTLVDRTVTSLDSAGVPVERREEILNIASIIQREARFEDDFYKVSRVIQNRLSPDNGETFGKLQMDSTAQYGYGEMHDGTVSSSREALEDDNAWNTYVHPGLPIGPIANPGDVAIDAAMHPADGPWLYFVTVNLATGETVFTTTYAEHQKAVTQWQDWCKANPDSGC
ncbi:endolytic transglycosylase MltG [Microbacterium sp. W1N]|uniref:endolytic transglycosylase MltG n=1 Tax=Microbacterium festucae TaxID=2977531 RepID=UPI0021C00EC0|nr:endolytic transglycosylase MltG [Microbacterium festucae]MCT9820117.1 endolytic transglycosylase MltG [Microbacterium festucae]